MLPQSRPSSAHPTLRNIAVTAPYMHDGSWWTRSKTWCGIMQTADATRGRKATESGGFAITPREVEDLVAFLKTLTDEKFLTNPAFSNPLSNPDLSQEDIRKERTRSEPPEWLTGGPRVIFTGGMSLVAIIGAGEIGGAVARALAVAVPRRMVCLIDEKASAAAGKALDLMQSGPLRSRIRESRAPRISRPPQRARGDRDCRSFGSAAEWAGETGPALLRRLARGRLPGSAVVVCAGRPASPHAAGFDELGLSRRRVVGSSPEALASTARALVAIEARAASIR